ncbi:sensor histidine kinase [Actinomadura madurae]|uniref:sensor histidine kinase n=2 Tax=Actinomadura madurae TaxID=1993 RepID=UPI0020270E38|nr:histidine kinase [Actinomadura madurae]MCP9955156.1 histidine kinase [Actinomadura madurae]MCQ0004056.1 histidine kinase [Actinomadura madurae]MCQ0020585.1 histidine kinase [Actinomadura madurae]URN00633.1 histidine kinase [Actinomadura madurae]
MIASSDAARRGLRAASRAAAGLLLGAFTAGAELVLLAVAAPLMAYALAFSRGRRTVPGAVAGGARLLVELERRRLRTFLGEDRAVEYGPLKALAYLVLRVPVGLLGGVILLLIAYGAAAGIQLAVGWWITGDYADGIPPTWWIVLYITVVGLVLLFLGLQGLAGVVALEKAVARRCLGPSPLEEYERRIAQLSVTRAQVVDAVDDERRRIERDLHDGVQQRLVALGMLIGRARRAGSGDRAAELLRQAHEESQRALADLREVTWRVYPAALDGEGLRAALETVAERSALPVTIAFDVPGRPPHAVETAAYFVVCEAVTNAAKHSGARSVRVAVGGSGTMIGVRIEDDGAGGADPAGGGLAGLARRVAALDGAFTVDSPPGGPTVITAELPCG